MGGELVPPSVECGGLESEEHLFEDAAVVFGASAAYCLHLLFSLTKRN